jgi:hypothetical protein
VSRDGRCACTCGTVTTLQHLSRPRGVAPLGWYYQQVIRMNMIRFGHHPLLQLHFLTLTLSPTLTGTLVEGHTS